MYISLIQTSVCFTVARVFVAWAWIYQGPLQFSDLSRPRRHLVRPQSPRAQRTHRNPAQQPCVSGLHWMRGSGREHPYMHILMADGFPRLYATSAQLKTRMLCSASCPRICSSDGVPGSFEDSWKHPPRHRWKHPPPGPACMHTPLYTCGERNSWFWGVFFWVMNGTHGTV